MGVSGGPAVGCFRGSSAERLRRASRKAQAPGRLRHGGCDRRQRRHSRAGCHAGKIQHRTYTRRGRGPLHRLRARALPYPSAAGPGCRDRSGSRRLDSRTARDAALVRSLRRPPHSRHSFVPGQVRLDAALHGQRNGSELRAGLLGTQIHCAANGGEVACVPLIDEAQIRVILLDIEGTTTPVDFVYQTLFPYASRKLESFLREHSQDPEIHSLIQDLRAQHDLDERNGLEPPGWLDNTEARLRSSVSYGQWLIARDSKCTPLKSLQGKIWQQGFASRELRGEVFPDVPIAFERWRRQKRTICIYSSGSVLAQQLLFRSTSSGDLTSYISAFFDTRVGAKSEGESYKKIAASLSYEPNEFLFISDAVKEIEAARSAGMQAILCERDSHSASPTEVVIRSFENVLPG